MSSSLVGRSVFNGAAALHFADYEATYGTLGAMIVLMLFFCVAGLVLLVGSEINVVLEQHLSNRKSPTADATRSRRRP